MRFAKHLFISYAHIDNEPVTEDDMGLVARIHRSLGSILSKRLGCTANIWRDERLQGNDVFAAEIIGQFPETAALVAVVSPRYLQSAWCLREARAFCEAAQRTGGMVVDNKSRVFKVVALPVDSQAPLPPEMRDTLGFDFFMREPNGITKELNPAYDPGFGPKLASACAGLAMFIADVVKRLEAEPGAPVSAKPTVYLAECSFDRRGDREALRTELHMRGYRLLPDRHLPDDEAEYRAEVARMLADCALSIHLVGSLYGAVRDGPSQRSVVELQNELAVQRARETGRAGLKRIVSLPDGTRSDDDKQQLFIRALHEDAAAQFGADVIVADLEAVKAAVLAALERIEHPPLAEVAALAAATAVGAPAAPRRVYLICDQPDRKATVALRKLLMDQGLEVQIPIFDGEPASVRGANQQRLAECDAVLVYYGCGTEAWKDSVDADLRKAAALRPGRPMPQVYTWLAEPGNDAKTDCIDLGGAGVIDATGGFTPALAEPVLKALRDDHG
jgi:hypothetical protein